MSLIHYGSYGAPSHDCIAMVKRVPCSPPRYTCIPGGPLAPLVAMLLLEGSLNLSNLLVGGDTADEAWPKAIRNVISQPEPSHGRLIKTIDIHRDVIQSIVWFGIVGIVWH